MQARLREFYLNSSSQGAINVTYLNYLTNLYPVLYSYSEPLDTNMLSTILCMAVIGVLSLAIVLVWIYAKLRI